MKGKKRGPTRRIETTGCGGLSVAFPRGASLNRPDYRATGAAPRPRVKSKENRKKKMKKKEMKQRNPNSDRPGNEIEMIEKIRQETAFLGKAARLAASTLIFCPRRRRLCCPAPEWR